MCNSVTLLFLSSSARVRGRDIINSCYTLLHRYTKFIIHNSLFSNFKRMNKSQIRFAMASHATWSVLHDPVLTKLYSRHWKRYVTRATKELSPTERLLTLYGYIFNLMYHEV